MFVTDTHPIAYYAGHQHSRLSRRPLGLFEQAQAAKALIYVPTPVLWEISRLITAGTIELPFRFDYWCQELESKPGFIIESLTWSDVNEARHLPFRDPMDCLIAGTAKCASACHSSRKIEPSLIPAWSKPSGSTA